MLASTSGQSPDRAVALPPEQAGFEILAEGPFRRDQLPASAAARWDLHLDTADARFVAREWRRAQRTRQRQGILIYNGRLWRVGDYHHSAAQLQLELGRTSYREYVGTRQPTFFAGRPRTSLANPLAVCVTIVTGDSKIVVVRRSGVDVDDGLYDVPGGFVERDKDADPFAAMAREVHEELGLALDPDRLLCLGLIYDLRHPHHELCFETRIPEPFEYVRQLRPLEREASSLDGVPYDQQALQQFLVGESNRMSPTGEGCLTLYLRRHGRRSLE